MINMRQNQDVFETEMLNFFKIKTFKQQNV